MRRARNSVRVGRLQQGFTIVELMIATIVFSSIMVIASATVVRFTTGFQRGVTHSNTQNVARSIIDDLSETIQTAGQGQVGGLASNGSSKGYCIDGVRYSYVLQQQLSPSTRALVKEAGQGLGCDAKATNINSSSAGAELLAENIRLMDFTIKPLSGGALYSISIKVAYGDTDLFENPTDPAAIRCKGGAGSQFCAVSALSTTVKRRL